MEGEISGFTRIKDTLKGGMGYMVEKSHIKGLQGKKMYRSLKTSSERGCSEEEKASR